MNAAGRLFNQGILSRAWVVSVFFTRFQLLISILVASVLLSSLGMIYVTNTARSMHANIQQLQVERDQLHQQWGQLLLEKSSWVMQARVHSIAANHLNMVVPEGKSVVIIKNGP